MKIAIFHELHEGGARRASNEYSQYLRKNNSVDLYVVDRVKDDSEKQFYDNIFFYSFLPKKWTGKNWKVRLYKDTIELYKLNKLHKKIAKDIEKQKYDRILVFPSKFTEAPFILKFLKTNNTYFAMEPLRLVYDPLVVIPTDIDFFRYKYEQLNRFIRKKLDYKNIRSADKVVGSSKHTAKILEGIYKLKVKVVYLGVDINFFKRVNKKRDIDLLYIGSMDEVNGYDILEKVKFGLDKNVRLREVLYEKEWLRDVEIRELYRRSKIVVSTSRNEPLGIVPLEAMACGAVILAINEAGYKETVIDGKNGYLLGEDPKGYLTKINSILKSDKLFNKLSDFASKNVNSEWSWEKKSKDLEAILKKN